MSTPIDEILDLLGEGIAIATDGSLPFGPACPRIQDLPNGRHLGFGIFEGEVDGMKYRFDGGGGMRRLEYEGQYIGWCPISPIDTRQREALHAALGISLSQQRQAVVDWYRDAYRPLVQTGIQHPG